MKKIFLAAVAVCINYAVFSQSTGKLELKEGANYEVKSNMNMNLNVEAMGQKMEMPIKTESLYSIEVVAVNSDSITVTGKTSKFKLDMSYMGMPQTYDSEDPDTTGPMAEGMKGIIDKPQTIVIDNQGNIVRTIEDVEIEMAGFASQAIKSVGPQSAFFVVPEGLKAGDTFERSNEADSVSKITYTMKSLNGDIAMLTFNGPLASNFVTEQMGMEIETNLQGTTDGEMVVNVKSGVLQGIKSKTKLNGSSVVMGQEMPTSMELNSDSTVEKKK